jgi:serine/threonine protein phosphatase PrpC
MPAKPETLYAADEPRRYCLMPPSLVPLSLSIQAAGATDIGRVRKHNEDTVLLRHDLQLFIVADGAGGHNAGNIASALATTSIANFFENTQKATEALPQYHAFGFSTGARRLAQAIQRANRDILEIAKNSMRHRGMGTTVVAVWVQPQFGALHVGHVGDSRLYRYRAGQLEQLTRDHSLYNDVLELQPEMTDAALARLPRNVVTRALGMEGVVRASVSSHNMVPGDRYLLCSDGLTDGLTELEMALALEVNATPDEAAKALIGRALESESQDNIGVVVLFYDIAADASPHARIPTSPYMPPKSTPGRAVPPLPPTPTDDSAPEIVILGMEYETDLDPSGQIHVVPPGSATEGILSAIDSFVGPMRSRSSGALRTLSVACASCGAVLDGEDVTCPQCNAPQPLGP